MTNALAINPDAPCWLWTRGKTGKGYGAVTVKGKLMDAHLYLWRVMRGPVPTGLHLHHLCPNRHCVNPQHLRPVTPSEHAVLHRRRTHCKHGHALTPSNVYEYRGARGCVECRRARAREWYRNHYLKAG